MRRFDWIAACVLIALAAGVIYGSYPGTLTANHILLGNGSFTQVLASLGTTTSYLQGNAGGAPTFSAVNLAGGVTGVLAHANGGAGTSDGAIDSLYGAAPVAQVAANTIYFSAAFQYGASAFGTTISQHVWVVPHFCTLQNFYAVTNTTQSVNNSLVLTLYDNGTDPINQGSSTGLVITIAAGATAQVFSDLTHTFAVQSGELLMLQLQNNANVGSALITTWGVECQ